MDDQVDLLQIKIEEARKSLAPETVRAIDAVPWKATLLGLRESKGYSFEQLGDLEIETELLLCGLLAPEDYPKELEARMLLPKAKVEELVNDMNQLVFARIREEMIKNTERKKIFTTQSIPVASKEVTKEVEVKVGNSKINTDELGVLDKAGIKILDPKLTTLELKPPTDNTLGAVSVGGPGQTSLVTGQALPTSNPSVIPPILTQKFAGAFKIPTSTTEFIAEEPHPQEIPKAKTTTYPKGADPYRLPPEE